MQYEGDANADSGLFIWDIRQIIGEGTGRLEIRGQVETIQTTTLLRSLRILRGVLKS